MLLTVGLILESEAMHKLSTGMYGSTELVLVACNTVALVFFASFFYFYRPGKLRQAIERQRSGWLEVLSETKPSTSSPSTLPPSE
jgi:hypothetical protein